MRVNRPLASLAAMVVATAAAAEPHWRQHDMARPRPEVVAPAEQGLPAPAPADAVVLFDGTDLSAWESVNGGPAEWRVDGDAFVVEPGTGAIQTAEGFGDVQLHVEWSAPTEIVGESQGRGNSGVFLMKLYEVQVLDSYENESYADGQAASIYGQYPPLVNAMRAPGEWNAYDIFFRRPRFSPAGALEEPARLTVIHNGILVQNNEELWGGTNWIQALPYDSHPDAMPIMLQDHGNPVRFRNIWVRPIEARPVPEGGWTAAAAGEAPALSAEELDALAGRYERAPGQFTIIRRDGDRLLANVIGDELELVPVSENEFRFARSDVSLTFELDAAGAPEGLVMRLGGVDYPASRVADGG
jgi:hypothetical protein